MGRHILNILLFIAGLTIVTLLNVLQPERKTVSLLENRNLTEMPVLSVESFFDGSFTSQFEEFWKDTFIFRDEMVEISAAIKDLKGMTGEEEVTIVNVISGDDFAGQGLNPSDIQTAVVEHTHKTNPRYDVMDWSKRQQLISLSEKNLSKAPDPPSPPPPNPEGELVNSYLVVKDRALEILRFYESSGKFYADTLNAFTAKLDDSIKFTSVIVPSHIEFIPDSKYKAMSYPQDTAISFIHSNLTTNIHTLDAHSILQPHKDEYIYFRTDHHWTALGAYYIYREFALQNGFQPLELDDYTYSSHPGFLGTLYSRTQAKSLRDNPDKVAVYKPDVKADYTIHTRQGVAIKEPVINLAKSDWQNKYLMFIGGDEPLSIIRIEQPAEDNIEQIDKSNSDDQVEFVLDVPAENETNDEVSTVNTDSIEDAAQAIDSQITPALGEDPIVSDSGEVIEDNGKILILKDSYANAFIPFLQPHYNEIHIVDPRHYKENIITYIKENEIREVVFFNYYVVICAYTGFAKHLNRITSDPPVIEDAVKKEDSIASDESTETEAENGNSDNEDNSASNLVSDDEKDILETSDQEVKQNTEEAQDNSTETSTESA